MKTMKLLFLLVIGILILCVTPVDANPLTAASEVNYPTRTTLELVQNGGCEMPLEGGEIPGWMEIVGSNWTQRTANPSPYEGSNYFFAGAGASAELIQDVDVTEHAALIDAGTKQFSFSAWVRSWDQAPADISQIILEYLNHDKSSVLATFDLGQDSNTTTWTEKLHSANAPVGTRYIRIRLISIRRSGTNNDGYFDAVSITTDIPDVMAPSELEILIQGSDVALNWAPVTTDTAGTPITITEYRIYASDQPYFVCETANLAGTSILPNIVLSGHGTSARKFYKVIAIAAE